MDAQSYFDSQAHFNKWLKQLTEDEQRMVVDMLNEFRQQNLQQCDVVRCKELLEQKRKEEDEARVKAEFGEFGKWETHRKNTYCLDIVLQLISEPAAL